jgi:hypothetical protein
VEGHGPTESVVIAHETLHSMVQDKAQGLVLKLDYEKAFDKVSLDFLLDLLAKRGFIVKTISWIKADYNYP